MALGICRKIMSPDNEILLLLGKVGIDFLDKTLSENGKAFCQGLELMMTPLLGSKLSGKIAPAAIVSFSKGIHHIAKAFHMLAGDDNLTEVGYRICQAAQHKEFKRMEDFQNFHDYYNYLKEAVPIQNKEMGEIEKNELRYLFWGTMGTALAMEEESDITLSAKDMAAVSISGMTGEELLFFNKAIEQNGGTIRLADYLQGNLTFKEEEAITNSYIAVEKELHPDAISFQIMERLDDMKSAFRNESAFVHVHESENC